MKRPLACVLGDLSLVRALGRANIPVAFASSRSDDLTRYSRYVHARIALPPLDEDPRGVVDALTAWAVAQDARPVLFYQGDEDLLLASRYRVDLARVFHLLLPDAELVEQSVDKIRFASLAERMGLPVAKTFVVKRGQSTARLEAWDVFPAILKPGSRIGWDDSDFLRKAAYGRFQKALRVEDRAALDRLLPLLLGHEDGFLLQYAIEGEEDRVQSYHAYVRPSGEIAAEFTGRKVRTSPRAFGMSSCVEISDDGEVARVGRDIVARLAFHGVVKLDFKRDQRDERLYLLELNPRFSLWHHLAAVAGVNIPALVYQDLVMPWSTRARPSRARAGARWMAGRKDLRSFREHRAAGVLSLGEWLMEVARIDVNEDLSFRDPLPACVDALATLRRHLPPLRGRPASPWSRTGEV
jgi:D-aspartate ligase